MSANKVYPSRTPEGRHAAYVAKRARLVPGRMSEPMRSGVACTPAVSILAAARANGVKRYTVGLTDLLVTVRPVERYPRRGKGPIVSGGRDITLTPVGRVLDPEAAAALLQWATEYISQGAT